MKLPELLPTRSINVKNRLIVTNQPIHNYDVIIGRNVLNCAGIILDGAKRAVHWDNLAIPYRLEDTGEPAF